jgi:hypothetical protein
MYSLLVRFPINSKICVCKFAKKTEEKKSAENRRRIFITIPIQYVLQYVFVARPISNQFTNNYIILGEIGGDGKAMIQGRKAMRRAAYCETSGNNNNEELGLG